MKHLKYFNKNWTIYCDMDGVICDWNHRFKTLVLNDFNRENDTDIKSGDEFEKVYGKGSLWPYVDEFGVDFWANIEWKPDGKELWNFILPYNPIILSKPTFSPHCYTGKKIWCKREIPGTEIVLERKKSKYANPKSILIDDTEKNIKEWESVGGIGVLHNNTKETIKKLKKIL